MKGFQYNLVRDGKGGQIKFPIFISQADMDLIEKEFVAQDGDVFVVTRVCAPVKSVRPLREKRAVIHN